MKPWTPRRRQALMEHGTESDVAEYQRGHQDGYNRALAAVVDGKYPALTERLAPLEAAAMERVVNAAINEERFRDSVTRRRVWDAVRTLREAQQ